MNQSNIESINMNKKTTVWKVFEKPSNNLEIQELQLDENKTNDQKRLESKFSRFCQDRKECENSECTFAHSIDQLTPLKCKFENECRNIDTKFRKCYYFHPKETKESYIQRLDLLKPKFIDSIKSTDFIKKDKSKYTKNKDTKQLGTKSLPFKSQKQTEYNIRQSFKQTFPELQVKTSKNNIQDVLNKLLKMGFRNFNLEIIESQDTEIINLIFSSYINFMNEILNKYGFTNLYKMDQEDKEKLNFTFVENGITIRAINKDKTIKNINTKINNKLSGLDFLNKLQSILETINEFKIDNIVINSDKTLDINI
jgi:hypothetical protein